MKKKIGDLFHCMRGVTAFLLGRCLRPEGTRPYIQQMPRTWQMTQVGKRKIELSNLEKVLCPEDGILKVPCRGTERQATH